MFDRADRDIKEIVRFFSARGLEAGYLILTATGSGKSIMDAHAQFIGCMRRAGLHDYGAQSKGAGGTVIVKTWLVKKDGLVETESVLYRSQTEAGDSRIWIDNLTKYAVLGSLLAFLAHEGEIYVVNTSEDGLLESAADPSSPLSHLLDLLVGAKSKPLDDRFSEWNLRLLRSFFSEASKGEEVFLRVDKDLLDQIGQDIGGDSGFLEAVRKGPGWGDQSRSFTQSIIMLRKQRKTSGRSYKDPGRFDPIYRGLRAPTYLPYLAALVRNDAENASAYYSGLLDDLELKHHFGSQEMEQVETVWADLAEWTKANDGRFGRFKLRRLGGYRFIGVPRSQSILKPSDVEDLARVFVQAQVRPGQELSDESLTQILSEARATCSTFTAGFQKALEIDDFEQPIRAAIHTAYSDWDGTLPSRGGSTSIVESPTSSSNEGGFCIGISLSVV